MAEQRPDRPQRKGARPGGPGNGGLRFGRGLFGWTDPADVVRALETIEADYAAHARAAREIAAGCFAAETVLASLMERAGAGMS